MRLGHENREVVKEQVKEKKEHSGLFEGTKPRVRKAGDGCLKGGVSLCLGRDSGAGLMRWNRGTEAIGFTT